MVAVLQRGLQLLCSQIDLPPQLLKIFRDIRLGMAVNMVLPITM